MVKPTFNAIILHYVCWVHENWSESSVMKVIMMDTPVFVNK